MFLIAALDELLVAVDVALAVQAQTTPLAVLVAIGAVAIASAVTAVALAALIVMGLRHVSGLGPGAAGLRHRERQERQVTPATRHHPVGARGARAPGQPMRRPVLRG